MRRADHEKLLHETRYEWEYQFSRYDIACGYNMLHPAALEQFLSVYRHRSINKACRELGLSQPALSKTIRRLEDQLRVKLFVRSSAGVTPTEFADVLAQRADVIRGELSRAVSEIESMRKRKGGEARIGTGPALASSLLADRLADFLQREPYVNVRLVEGLFETLSEAVAGGRLDLAITTKPAQAIPPELISEVLLEDALVFVAGNEHPLAGKAKRSLAELLSYPWVLPPRGGILWQRLVEIFDAENLVAPEPQVETYSSGCIKALLRSGPFLSLTPLNLIERDVARGEIAILNVAAPACSRKVIVLQRRHNVLPPGTQALLKFIKRELRVAGTGLRGGKSSHLRFGSLRSVKN